MHRVGGDVIETPSTVQFLSGKRKSGRSKDVISVAGSLQANALTWCVHQKFSAIHSATKGYLNIWQSFVVINLEGETCIRICSTKEQ